MTQFEVVLRGGKVLRSPTAVEFADIAIAHGKIVAIAPQLDLTGAEIAQELDLAGKLVSPPFVESHIHLDSVMTAGQPRWNRSGTLFEGIEIWSDRKQTLSFEDVKQRAIATIKQQVQQGVLLIRTHADVSEASLTALKALLAAREAVQDWATVQVVAFPQDGVFSRVENRERLEEALKLGADAVGGIPHYELTREDGVQAVQLAFELAQRYDRLIDIHCDEIDDDQSRFLEVMAACALRSNLGPRVTASHTTAFGSYNNAYANKLLGFVARSQLNLIANPLINITLQGRTDTYPKRRGLTRVKELWQHGVNLSLGHDCIQDPWYSLGTGNMLDVASMAVHVCHMTGTEEIDACYNMITWNGAQTLNLTKDYGLEPGKPANLVVLDAVDRYEAIRCRSVARYVFARGKLIAETQPAIAQFHG